MEDNILHIARHGFTPEEVEEIFVSRHKIRRTRQRRFIALGETLMAGWLSRFLHVYRTAELE